MIKKPDDVSWAHVFMKGMTLTGGFSTPLQEFDKHHLIEGFERHVDKGREIYILSLLDDSFILGVGLITQKDVVSCIPYDDIQAMIDDAESLDLTDLFKRLKEEAEGRIYPVPTTMQ